MTSAWCSQILAITQAIASLTFEFLSANIYIKFGNPGTIISKNLYFSGPSVIAPRAINDEYLLFQSGELIFLETKSIIGAITASPINYATWDKQHPAERATPHSSSASSSSSIVTF